MMLAQLKWPLTVLLSIALVAVAVIVAGGDALGIDPELRREVMQGLKAAVAGLGAVLLPLIVAALRRDVNGNGIPDVLEGYGAPTRKRRETIKPPPDQGAGGASALLLACVVAASTLTSACGLSAIGAQAKAAQLTTIAAGVTGDVVDTARAHALDEVEAAHPAAGPERDAALDAEAARWRPAGEALDALREVLIGWALALEAARAVGEEGAAVLWPRVLALAAQAAAIYGRVAALATSLGATGVPALPGAVTGLLGSGGAQ